MIMNEETGTFQSTTSMIERIWSRAGWVHYRAGRS
jgi:hypothetical protein